MCAGGRGNYSTTKTFFHIITYLKLAFLNIKHSCSIQFSHSVVSNSLQPHGLQHARLPCLSPTPGAYSNSCPLSQWCHPTISSSVIPSSCLQSFPTSGSFLMSQLFTSDGQSIGASASASVLLMNIQGWFPLGLTGLISLQYERSMNSMKRAHTKCSLNISPGWGIQGWIHLTV